MNSYLSREELDAMGFKSLGQNVCLSRKASVYAPERIQIGANVRIDDFVFLSGDIALGSHVHIAPFCSLVGGSAGAGIVMEDFSGLSGNVMIYAVSDDYSGDFMTNPTVHDCFTNVKTGEVALRRYVIVGAGSVILPGVEIGEGAAVAAMSLVTRQLPPWKICAGIPARPLKDRSRNLLELEKQYRMDTLPSERGCAV
ncbi:acyltransferase [Oscillospiraceae bacterium WX1]